MQKEREYIKWINDYSNKDEHGLERFNLTFVQIRKIIAEEKERLLFDVSVHLEARGLPKTAKEITHELGSLPTGGK